MFGLGRKQRFDKENFTMFCQNAIQRATFVMCIIQYKLLENW